MIIKKFFHLYAAQRASLGVSNFATLRFHSSMLSAGFVDYYGQLIVRKLLQET